MSTPRRLRWAGEPGHGAGGNGHPDARLVLEPGAGDAEHPQAPQGHLQRKLARIIDAQVLDDMSATLTQRERWLDVRRLRELRDESVSHDWLWSIGPGAGGLLEPDEYATAVRHRLGADHVDETILCCSCGRALLDTSGSHALCCAPGASTRGHNDVCVMPSWISHDLLMPLPSRRCSVSLPVPRATARLTSSPRH